MEIEDQHVETHGCHEGSAYADGEQCGTPPTFPLFKSLKPTSAGQLWLREGSKHPWYSKVEGGGWETAQWGK